MLYKVHRLSVVGREKAVIPTVFVWLFLTLTVR